MRRSQLYRAKRGPLPEVSGPRFVPAREKHQVPRLRMTIGVAKRHAPFGMTESLRVLGVAGLKDACAHLCHN